MTVDAPSALRGFPSSSFSRLLKLSLRGQEHHGFSSRSSPAFSRTVRQETRNKPVLHAQRQQHDGNDASPPGPIRVEVSPSALRSLQAQDPSSSTTSSSSKPAGDESLIEKNLRKRAMAGQVSSSLSPEQSFHSNIDETEGSSSDRTATLLERYFQRPEQVSPTLQDSSSLPADVTTVSRGVESESSQSYGMSSSCPITTAFWQEAPPGFSMGNFHSLDFYVWFFRFALILHLGESTKLLDFSFSSLFWLLASQDMLPNAGFLFMKEDSVDKSPIKAWNKDASKDLARLIDDREVLGGTLDAFSVFWNASEWMPRVESGKASDLVAVLAYSTYVYILSGAAGSVNGSMKKLEDLSASLKQVLVQLHGPVPDPMGIWEKALRGFSDVLDGTVFVYEHALIFPCKFPTGGGRVDLGPMVEEVQHSLDKELKSVDMVALLQRSPENEEKFFLVIAPWYWTLPMESAQATPFPALLVMLSLITTAQFMPAGLDLGFSWEPYGVSLGWSAIVASVFLAKDKKLPAFCPFPNVGAIGKFTSDLDIVPSRQSLVGSILKVSCAPLVVSLLLMAFGIAFCDLAQYNASRVVDFHGYVLVPPDFFSYSGVLTKLLQSISIATIAGEDGGSMLAASPFALAGLLGLNFTAFCVFPGLQTEGTHLLRGLLGSEKQAKDIGFACTMVLAVSLTVHSPWLGLGWLAFSFTPDMDFFVKDEVSDLDLLAKVAGFTLVATAVACFIPLPQ